MSSLKIERDTYQQGAGLRVPGVGNIPGVNIPGGDHLPGTSGRHPIAEEVGTALTGGKASAGTKGYLAVRGHCTPLPLSLFFSPAKNIPRSSRIGGQRER